MRKNFLNRPAVPVRFYLLIFPVFFFSCKTTQKAVGGPETVALKSEAFESLFEKVLGRQFQYEWLSAKAAVEYTDHNNDVTTFTVNLRAANDSVIWLSVSPLLGIEAVRVLITRDSIRLLDRVHHTSITRDFRFLEDLLKTNVSLEILQAILTANYFEGTDGQEIQSVYDDSPYYILSTLPKLPTRRDSVPKDPAHPVVQDFWIDTTYRIVKTGIEDDSLHRALTVEYSAFAATNTGWFPQHLQLSIASDKPSRISIAYVKYSFEGPLSFPFSVPEKYSRE